MTPARVCRGYNLNTDQVSGRSSIWRRKARAGAVRRETGGDAADPEAADDEQAEAVRQQEEPGEMGTRETRNLVRIVLVCLQLDMFPPYTKGPVHGEKRWGASALQTKRMALYRNRAVSEPSRSFTVSRLSRLDEHEHSQWTCNGDACP